MEFKQQTWYGLLFSFETHVNASLVQQMRCATTCNFKRTSKVFDAASVDIMYFMMGI